MLLLDLPVAVNVLKVNQLVQEGSQPVVVVKVQYVTVLVGFFGICMQGIFGS